MRPINRKFPMLLWYEQRRLGNNPHAKPAPFPGKFPTRIYLRAGKWRYFGKPSVNAYRTFSKLYPKNPMDYCSIEFDCKTVIFGQYRNGPNERQKALFHEQLWAVYHPQIYANVFLNWMSYGVRTLGHRYVIGADGIKGVR